MSKSATTIDDLQEYPISRINFEFNPKGLSWTVVQKQFPLLLAYSTTIYSCQGLTLDRIVTNLQQGVFAYSQLYTPLTCISYRDYSRILITLANALGETTNIVSHELLL